MYVFLFSVPGEVEGFSQMQGSIIKRQLVDSGPQVEDVAVHATIGLEALTNVLAQVNGESPHALGRLRVHRARTAALLTAATQLLEAIQLAQILFHGDLLPQIGQIDIGLGDGF